MGPLNQCRARTIHDNRMRVNSPPTASGVQLRVTLVTGYETGDEKSTVMVATHKTEIQPTSALYRPRLNGPGTRLLYASVTRNRIGNA
jgi:hypothetical protein